MISLLKDPLLVIFEALREAHIKTKNSRTEFLYMTMHPDLLDAIITSPDIETYLNSRPSIIGQKAVEEIFGCQVFLNREMHRNKIKIYAEHDILLEDQA